MAWGWGPLLNHWDWASVELRRLQGAAQHPNLGNSGFPPVSQWGPSPWRGPVGTRGWPKSQVTSPQPSHPTGLTLSRKVPRGRCSGHAPWVWLCMSPLLSPAAHAMPHGMVKGEPCFLRLLKAVFLLSSLHCEGEQNMLSQNMPLWCVDNFQLKAIRTLQIGEMPLPLP